MKLAFTTLACPKWDLQTILDRGREYGFDGLDFRGIGDALDITTMNEFTREISATKRKIADSGLEVCGISSSIRICDESNYKNNIEEAKRTIRVALELSCPNIRVFGGGDLEKIDRAAAAETGRKCIREILSLDGAHWVNWLFETHDSWISGSECKMLLDQVTDPAFGCLWDICHPPRMRKEPPEVTFAAIGDRVKYTHIKDAIYDPEHPKAMKDGWRYVPPGEGQIPLTEAIKLLKQRGYQGYLTLEHEKRWHPEIEEPEVILPKYVAWGRKVIGL